MPAAILAGLLTLVVAALLRFRPPAWIRRRLSPDVNQAIAQPSVVFYAEALRQLTRLGVFRGASQTPGELAQAAEDRFREPSVPKFTDSLQFLTTAFYQRRFGSSVDLEKHGLIEHAHPLGAGPAQVQVDQALVELTRCVDSMLNQESNREQAT
jgi:hypothetical protein